MKRAIARQLQAARETDIVTCTHAKLDLINQLAVRDFMQAERPDVGLLWLGRLFEFPEALKKNI